jgi:hypothetical protein
VRSSRTTIVAAVVAAAVRVGLKDEVRDGYPDKELKAQRSVAQNLAGDHAPRFTGHEGAARDADEDPEAADR